MRDKNVPHSAAIKETEVHTAKKDDTIGKGRGWRRERKWRTGWKRDERTVLSPANALPSTSSLLREEHEKSNVSIFRFLPPNPRGPPALTLQSFRSLPCHVPFFLLRFSRNIPTERTVRRSSFLVTSSYNWNLRTTGTDRLPVIWKG